MGKLISILESYKESPIAIYGLGVETEKVLNKLDNLFNIVGLLDGFTVSGDIYGKSVIPLKKCIDMNVKLIIVVARPGSCRAIAKRVGEFCKDNHIALIDVRGEDLLEKKQVKYNFDNVKGVSKASLEEMISEHDVVSFDLFDTLVTRQVLNPTDVIEITDMKLKEQGIYIDNFFYERLYAEKQLSKKGAPTLVEIYEYMLKRISNVKVEPQFLAEIEWRTDYDLIIPRFEAVDVLNKAYKQGKQIYIVTDTYYSFVQISSLLNKCNISDFTDVFVSCEYGTSKTQKLFSVLKDRVGDKKVLHIGDDLIADIESSVKNGFTACHIHSGLELFEKIGGLGFDDTLDSLNGKIRMGLFVSKIFNSPFQFENESNSLKIFRDKDVGYLFMAPVISDFVIWIYQMIQRYEFKNIWFSARDGYLIKKMYDLLCGKNESVYFLTSRMAVVRSGTHCKSDIDYVSEMKFTGNLEEQLKQRFEVKVDTEDTENKTLYDFQETIFDTSAKNRENYLKYINSLEIYQGDIAFFDFVAKGTVQMYVERLVKRHLRGIYFLQLEKEYMKKYNLDVISFFEANSNEKSVIYEDYYIIEAILSSDEPSVVGFDKEGKPRYAVETRSSEEIDCILRVQDGILDYFKDYARICPLNEQTINKNLDEAFLSLLHKIKICSEGFKKLVVEDPFFNRKTNVKDLL